MRIGADGFFHLTYCTNIHPADGWEEVLANPEQYGPDLRARLGPNAGQLEIPTVEIEFFPGPGTLDYVDPLLREFIAFLMLALRNVAKARGGVAAMARETGMNRVALSRALSEAGNPELRSLTKILEASGLEFKVVPKTKRARRPQVRRTGSSRDAHRSAHY